MARYWGAVGFAETKVTAPGVHTEVITERKVRGTVTRASVQNRSGEYLNNDLSTTNMISIVCDAFVRDHVSAIRYVEWAGSLWVVTEVTLEAPRLLLRLGGVYNGPRPS